MESLERCPACRARLADAAICTRCGTDFTITRRAEGQADALERKAVQALVQGQTAQAGAAAAAATALTGSALAQVILQTLRRRACSAALPVAEPVSDSADNLWEISL